LLLFGLSTLFCVSAGLILLPLFGQKTASLVGVAWAKINSFITPMFVHVVGAERMDRKQSYVIASNHQSSYDIFVIYGWMPVDFKWVMKAELRKALLIGYFCNKLGHIFVDRSNPESAIASINAAKERIKNGTSIMFFPEGTWSKDGNLLEFKKGAFKFAIDLGLPVLPVTIVGTNKILPGFTFALFPGRAKLIIHDPISIEGWNDSNLGELMKRTRDVIQSGLDEFS
jgi:1-acyl-sn-glycerol-3-phosphate acyltransferase